MEKVLKILIVFGLLMVVIMRSLRVKEKRFREYYYSRKGTLPGSGILMGVMDREAPGMAKDMERQLLYVPGERSVRVIDDLSGDLRQLIRLEKEVHGVVFDPEGGMLFCGSLDGKMTVIKQEDMGMYTVMQGFDCAMLTSGGPVGFGVDGKAGEIWIQGQEGWAVYSNA